MRAVAGNYKAFTAEIYINKDRAIEVFERPEKHRTRARRNEGRSGSQKVIGQRY